MLLLSVALVSASLSAVPEYSVADTSDPASCGEYCEGVVRRSNGEVRIVVDDLLTKGFGLPWGHRRVYSSRLIPSCDIGQGHNWMVSQWPRLLRERGGRTVIAVFDSCKTFWFEQMNTGLYEARFGVRHTLVHDARHGVYRLNQPDGTVWEFHDFLQSNCPAGILKRVISPGQQVTKVTSYTNNRIAEIERTVTEGELTTTEAYGYFYIEKGENAGRLGYVVLRRKQNNEGWRNILGVRYTYYDGNELHGSLGDLRMATLQHHGDKGWVDEKKYYYRYWNNSTAGKGFKHALKYVLNSEDLYDLIEDSDVSMLFSVSDEKLAPHATYYFQYDSNRRVSKMARNRGHMEYLFQYTDRIRGNDHNAWTRKTVERGPRGGTKTVYTNYAGQILLIDRQGQGCDTIEYRRYDGRGREVLRAAPSAVAHYRDDTKSQNGRLEVYLKPHEGYITLHEYYDATTAAAKPGGIKGFLRYTKTKKGNEGPEKLLMEYRYVKRHLGDKADGAAICLKALLANYIDGKENHRREYEYRLHQGTLRILEKTITRVSARKTKNGLPQPEVEVSRYDPFGHFHWSINQWHDITYHEHDPVTGERRKFILDVDSDKMTVPQGWHSSEKGGSHRVTDYEIDDRGRITQVLCAETDWRGVPIRPTLWTTYKDDIRETWRSGGYAGGVNFDKFTLTSPVSITKLNAAGRHIANIQAKRASAEGKLSATDEFPRSTWTSWTINSYRNGRRQYYRCYHKIPESGEGKRGHNYVQTDYEYDSMGRLIMIEDTQGNITRTVYVDENHSRIEYTGTNDIGATEDDPTGGGHPENNMKRVEHEYPEDKPAMMGSGLH